MSFTRCDLTRVFRSRGPQFVTPLGQWSLEMRSQRGRPVSPGCDDIVIGVESTSRWAGDLFRGVCWFAVPRWRRTRRRSLLRRHSSIRDRVVPDGGGVRDHGTVSSESPRRGRRAGRARPAPPRRGSGPKHPRSLRATEPVWYPGWERPGSRGAYLGRSPRPMPPAPG
jgi:hypothetical protein